MPLFYADTSALVKLVRDEPESDALREFLAGADIVSCELVLTEVPRAVRRATAPLLLAAGAFAEPALRALDAIHVAAAVKLSPVDAFVSYDERQACGRATRRPANDVAWRLTTGSLLEYERPGERRQGLTEPGGDATRPGVASGFDLDGVHDRR